MTSAPALAERNVDAKWEGGSDEIRPSDLAHVALSFVGQMHPKSGAEGLRGM
jgi:hypothetical protein